MSPRNLSQTTIHDVMAMGPIVAHDEDMDMLVTINGAYLNLWVNLGALGGWDNTDCRCGHPDLAVLTVAQAMDLGNAWLAEIRDGGDEDES